MKATLQKNLNTAVNKDIGHSTMYNIVEKLETILIVHYQEVD